MYIYMYIYIPGCLVCMLGCSAHMERCADHTKEMAQLGGMATPGQSWVQVFPHILLWSGVAAYQTGTFSCLIHSH